MTIAVKIRKSLTQYRIFPGPGQSTVILERPRWLKTGSLWAYRLLTWSVLAVGFAFAATVLALRYWILPNVERYRDEIARIASELAGQKITIGRIQASWEGLRPQLVLERVTVYDAAGRPALELSRVDNTLSWLSLAAREPRFHALDIYRPTLSVRRDARGVISVAGIELAGDTAAGGFADWLLRQRDIEVHEATIVWKDELRGAPELELQRVNFHLITRGGRHRFGLRAVAPPELAAPLDVRGEFSGDTLAEASGSTARLFFQLEYADIAAWGAWVPLPVEFPRGAGAVRAWLAFDRGKLVQALADVRLANVRMRLAKNLPELALEELAGRIGWKSLGGGFEFTTSRLALATPDGAALAPADFLLRVEAASGRRPARGELQANALELGALALLADRLPLPEEVHQRLAAAAPKGSLHDVALRWSGEWRDPSQFSARGRFHNLALNRAGRIPGFSGVSGSLDLSERGGTLQLNAQKARVDMPLVFRQPLEFDTLTAQLAWTRSGGETELRLNNVAFSNAHLSGALFGNYRTAGSKRGRIDLTGNLTRADARHASRYVPLVVGKETLTWLDTAFTAGQSNDVSLRLKGNLDEFPFAEGKGGVFQVVAKVSGATLDYASGWPRIENIAGDLVFRGRRMDVHARQGTILGVRLSRVHAEIPDLLAENEMLRVTGEAEGATRDFLAFLEMSPVLGMIDRFTEGWRVEGPGRLALKLAIPLAAPERSRVTGTYQFAGNTLVSDPDLPPLEQASGRIEFTESAVRAQNVTATLLGGPVTISATTERDATVRVNIQGRIQADAARRSVSNPFWAQQLRGTTDWRALFTLRKRSADVVIESSLQGLAMDLPAPLVKTAAESLPLRFERRSLGAGLERLGLAFGDVVSMNLVRRVEGERVAIVRGAVRFGGAAGEPERPGVWVSGAVKALDLDRWLALARQAGSESLRIEWGGVDLKLGTLDALGRRFSDVAVSTAVQGGQWRGHVTGKGIEGSLVWQPQGRGRILARMKSFAVPPPAPSAMAAEAGAQARELELPALDITVEQFANKDRALGRLELAAIAEGRDWRIERLRLVNAESTLAVEGVWQSWLAQPRTQVNVKLEVSDVGKLLVRLGYPEGVRRGTAKLEGMLSWAGAPYDFDYPTLTGNFLLEAAKGQFVKLEPGIGKLLGVLSLQALPRRIALDFRDIFSEGFAFDEITGAIKIQRGIATTDGLRIQGPSARITMSGEVDLSQETQKLRVRVTPHLSDTVSIAGALIGGPVAGVAAFLAQRVLKDPLDQIVSYEYSVSGTWSDPIVTRVERPAEGEPAPEKGRP
jgi:uncharacterized protein (TIGR02099 family)